MERTGVVIVGSHVQGLFMRISHFPTADETVLGWDYREALDGGKGSHQAIACARLNLAGDVAVDVDLPIQSDKRIIVRFPVIHRDPRQPITRPKAPRPPQA